MTSPSFISFVEGEQKKVFGLMMNGKLYGMFASKKEASKVQKEIESEGDGLDKFQVKPMVSEDDVDLPWFNPSHPDAGVGK